MKGYGLNYHYEFELKLMLDEAEYGRLLMQKGCDAFRQTNYYFDTDNFDMYFNKTVIRIREIENSFELTVKNKNPKAHRNGVVAMDENNLKIDERTAAIILSGHKNVLDYLPGGLVHSNKKLSNIGSITTIRKKICISESLPIAEIDKSIYCGICDFELEWEINEYEYNKAIESLGKIGIYTEGRQIGLSKYGRLVDKLRKDK